MKELLILVCGVVLCATLLNMLRYGECLYCEERIYSNAYPVMNSRDEFIDVYACEKCAIRYRMNRR